MRTHKMRLVFSLMLSASLVSGPVAQAADPAVIHLARAIGVEADTTEAKPKPKKQAAPKQPTKPTQPASTPPEKPAEPTVAAGPDVKPEPTPEQASTGVSKTWIWVGAGVAAVLAAAAAGGGGGGGGGAAPPHPQ